MSAPSIPWKYVQTPELVASLQNGYTGYIYVISCCPDCRNISPFCWSRLILPVSAGFCQCTLQNYNYRYEYTDAGLIDNTINLALRYTVPVAGCNLHLSHVTAPDGQTVDTGVRTIYMPAVLHCTNGIPDRCWQYSSTGITLDADQRCPTP